MVRITIASTHLREVLFEHGEKISTVELGQNVKIHPRALSTTETGPYNSSPIIVTQKNIESIKGSVKDLTYENLDKKSFEELLDLHDLHRPSNYIPHTHQQSLEYKKDSSYDEISNLDKMKEFNATYADVSDAIDVSKQTRYKQLLQQQKNLEQQKAHVRQERAQLVGKVHLKQGTPPKQPGQQDSEKLSKQKRKIKKKIAQMNGAIDQQISALDQEHQKLFLDHYDNTEHKVSSEKFQETAKKINDIKNLSKETKNQHAKLLKDIATLRAHKVALHEKLEAVRPKTL